MAIKIMIDAGHGGFDNGASYNGRTEKNDNLNLALALGDALSELGYDVEFTRTTDVYDSPTRKAQIGNESGSDYFISLHRNAAPYPNKYSGVETLVYNTSGIAYEMAENVIRFFKQKYPKCQMIMTSHNTNLMTNRIMRPDCLFILSRKGTLTALCNATERELREGHNLEKMYISGEFEKYE